ncbi:hypothetical protein [Mycolicibacterium rhodesiae]|uniref:Transglycosylase n=1 Tax=Mycolicibacterium rhodesiae TaxID=36814 RepID=A0A1X0J4B4_MYCRH|nr:hypothetical protein [Mycolicibacterium rhodesiae]MCV7345565.1 hypothetical protein [Mycolicibacterium rhodesiae]ORB56963.1 hypothetical protein BST42_00630 [Mycolicibacterium rhodesiae]
MKLTTNAHAWARSACLGIGALGVVAAIASAPVAGADPADPADPVAPLIVAGDTSAAPADAPAPAPTPVPVQHLSSPDNPPPGTTTTGTGTPPEGRLSYLRDLLHAMRTQEVSGSDALLLLTQRPLDANATPPPGMSSTPTGPVGTSALPPAADPAAPTG